MSQQKASKSFVAAAQVQVVQSRVRTMMRLRHNMKLSITSTLHQFIPFSVYFSDRFSSTPVTVTSTSRCHTRIFARRYKIRYAHEGYQPAHIYGATCRAVDKRYKITPTQRKTDYTMHQTSCRCLCVNDQYMHP